MKTAVKSLWVPIAIVTLFLLATLYEQQIVVKLGVATVAQLRTTFPYLLHIGIWLSLAYLLNRLIGISVWEPLSRRVPVPKLIRDVTAVLIYALAVTGIVGVVFNKPIGPFWAASGAAGIVIGLALNKVIIDIFIGLSVNFERPFEIGDYIQITGGPIGKVVEINWRTTRLLTNERNLIVIPNGKMGEVIVTNYSKPNPLSEFEILVCLDGDVRSDRALRVLNAAARSAAGSAGIVEEPAPKARLRGFAANGIDYKVKYFVDMRSNPVSEAQHTMTRAVLDQLRQAGLQLATPKQDMFYARMPQRQLDVRSFDDRVKLLDRVDLFSGLAVEERKFLAGHMRERLFKEGETIISRGDSGESMFVLFEGLLDVKIAFKPDEPETRVARLQAGTFFGEMSVLTGEPRSATIVAAVESIAFEITKQEMAVVLRERPEVVHILSEAVAARKYRNSEARARASADQRVAEERSLADQIIGKIFSFFALKPRPATA